MFRRRILCLMAASLVLTGCASSATPFPQQTPRLDSKLAADCSKLSKPTSDDYNALEDWIVQTVMPAYGDCASRHHDTVKAWPK